MPLWALVDRHSYLKTLSLLVFIGLHVPDILREDGAAK